MKTNPAESTAIFQAHVQMLVQRGGGKGWPLCGEGSLHTDWLTVILEACL